MSTVENLEIQLSAQSTKANAAIDTLINKLGTLNSSLSGINGSGLTGVANGVNKLSSAMQGMSSVKTSDFTRLANNIQKLSSIDAAGLNKASAAMTMITKSVNNLGNMSKSAEQITQLANGIKQLGYSSATKAVENIPKLATEMKSLMQTLSTAPKVSKNLIDMTNALAKLARTGASSGKAAQSLSTSMNVIAKTSNGMKTSLTGVFASVKSLSRSLLSAVGIFGGIYGAIRGIKSAIDIASDLTEVQNVVDTTFGNMAYKVEEFADTAIESLGMSELSAKQFASRFQAMGTAMGIEPSLIKNANQYLSEQTKGYIELSDSMADVSLNLTKLTADMASLYNLDYSDVAEDLEAIFTGQTRPLRTYGLDLTQATLQEWALKQGLDADMQSMSQAEKTMLRYQYVLANTTAAQGDFIKTANTWANQIRILQEQIKKFASVIGTGFIAAFKPFLQTLNIVMEKVITFTENVLNALGHIFGWEFEISGGGIADDLGDVYDSIDGASDDAGKLSDNLGSAAKNAKKLKSITLGIDELNINAPDDDSNSESGSGSAGSVASGLGAVGNAISTAMTQSDTMLKAYKSSIDSLYELGDYIGTKLNNAMSNINWDYVYEGARNFGSGFANFLNGLISPELFGTVGKTIAGALNTAVYTALSFGQTFDFYDFGVSLAIGINEFFQTFDFASLAKAINVWVDGIKNMIVGFLKTISWGDILKSAGDFLGNLELDTITVIIGAIAWKLGAVEVIKTALSVVLSRGIQGIVLSLTGVQLKKITFSGVAAAIGTALKAAISGASDTIILTISEAFGGISIGASTGIFAGIIGAVVAIGVAIKDLWDTSKTFRDNVSEMWGKIVDSFSGAKTEIWNNAILPLVDSFKKLGKSISDLWESIYNEYEASGAKALFELIVTTIGNVLTGVFTTAVTVVANAVKRIINSISGIVKAVTGFADLISGIFSQDWSESWEGITKIFGGIKDVFGNIVMPFTGIGVDIVNGLFQGILDAIADVGTWIYNNIFAPFIEGFKTAFGIHSPSKVMAEMGGYIMQGLANGITAAVSNVIKLFKDLWAKITGVFSVVATFFKQTFDSAYKNIKEVFKNIGLWFQERYNDIQKVFQITPDYFSKKFSSAYTNVKNAFNSIGTWFQGKWDTVAKVFLGAPDYFKSKFNSAYTNVKNAFNNINTWFQGKWDLVKGIFADVASFFKGKFDSGYKSVKTAFDLINTWFQGKWDLVKGVFGNVETFFKDAFEEAYDAVTKIWDSIGGYFKTIANSIIDPIQKAVNGVIDGINWIFDKVNGTSPLSNWTTYPQFASGTNGLAKDTVGVVNDQPGSTYKEMIVPPHGKPFIPEGRNVVLPMEKGTKIMPANQTKQFLNMPHFEGGIGSFFSNAWESVKNFTGNILDYLTNPGKIVQIAIDKFTDLTGWSGIFAEMASGAIGKVLDTVVDYVKNFFDEQTTANYDPGAGVEQWRTLATTALKLANQYTDSNLTALLTQMQHESGGNPNAINDWDINAINGTPSKGLMQVIDSTFQAYAYPGYNTDIWDPLSNMLAAINYTVDRYGSLYAGWTARGYTGYASGAGKISLADLIPTYSVGGFPEDGLFMANHNELVGQFANGRTAVANNDQIISGIEEAAYRGFSRAMSENTKQESLMRELISAVKEGKRITVDGRELVAAYDARKSRNGFSFT